MTWFELFFYIGFYSSQIPTFTRRLCF